MNPINPVRESETSSVIDVTTQMVFEEPSVIRKSNKDNHSPRPGHSRYLDLFDQPCSSAPIVIHLISKPKSFLLLGITEKLAIMNALTDTIGQVKAGTKWTHQGYLNKDMATGFESNHEQLATITALLQANRPLARPPYMSTINTTEKA
ncbi:hypothetical protein OUZ56_003232 [Daphnia magna]|uniref:Uncharacterized protein n=1 Tax=Daphnia magna TaxID=35525 RepID=A0ABR0A8E4_9CRUS|nr:hypothetical protein OUZ56_003232 [Daphnia magna]